jgi:hypothetical protein
LAACSPSREARLAALVRFSENERPRRRTPSLLAAAVVSAIAVPVVSVVPVPVVSVIAVPVVSVIAVPVVSVVMVVAASFIRVAAAIASPSGGCHRSGWRCHGKNRRQKHGQSNPSHHFAAIVSWDLSRIEGARFKKARFLQLLQRHPDEFLVRRGACLGVESRRHVSDAGAAIALLPDSGRSLVETVCTLRTGIIDEHLVRQMLNYHTIRASLWVHVVLLLLIFRWSPA